MAYHAHDPHGDHQYRGTDHNDSPVYHAEDAPGYQSTEDPSTGGYNTGLPAEEEKAELSDFEQQLEDEQGSQQEDEEEVFKQAANEVRVESDQEDIKPKKKKSSSIEDAIDKAIKEEKEVVHLDR